MALVGGGGGDTAYTHGLIVMALVALLLTPMFMVNLAPGAYSGPDADEVLDGYERMTGQTASTKVSVWPLTGIYLPYTGEFIDDDSGQTITYGYTKDGWLYGSEVKSYTPYQYRSTSQEYTVYKDSEGVFRYWQDSKDYNESYGTGHKGHWGIATQKDVDDGKAENVGDRFERDYAGDLYSEVNMDSQQTSDIFFVESSRREDGNGYFTYDYSGYRYSFQPISNYTAQDQDGNNIPIVATTTSLSLIWYQYLGGLQSGISGQLVISGSNGGIAYLNAANIVSAFNSNTSVADFDLVFNGIKMTVYIKIDPTALSSGMTVEQAYNAGKWSIMVTSLSVDSSAYLGTDFAANPMQILETVFDLFTFHMSDYNISPAIGAIVSLIYSATFYAALIAILLDKEYLWILVGILAAIQAVGSFWPF